MYRYTCDDAFVYYVIMLRYLEGTLSGFWRYRIDQFVWVCMKGMNYRATEYVV